MSIIKLEQIGFRYNEHWVLKDVSFEVEKGEFIGIIGPNGSGKTTLLKVIDGILMPQEGDIWINSTPMNNLKRGNLAKIISVVPQESLMIFPFTVQEIVLMGRAPHLGKWRFEGETDFRIAHQAMEMTDTLSLADRSTNALSGGERQRVLIARALAQQPQIMLLDEPTAFLDIKHQIDFFDLVKTLNKDQALTVIAATHDINMASLYCDRIILLRSGSIHCTGSPDEVISESNIKEVYKTNVTVDRNPVTGQPRVTLLSSHPLEGGSRLDSGAAPQLLAE
jgi:iron complex transport system ATP-binding protein